jgi:hypothetical protein
MFLADVSKKETIFSSSPDRSGNPFFFSKNMNRFQIKKKRLQRIAGQLPLK